LKSAYSRKVIDISHEIIRLSEHFTLQEFVFSQTAARRGIDNTPTPAIIENLRTTAAVMERVRKLLGDKPIRVSSGYRCPGLNAAVGGSENSAHMQGLAVDFTCSGYGSVFDVASAIASSNLEFDQLIYEFGTWVHLGLRIGPGRRILNSIFADGAGLRPGLIKGSAIAV